MELKPCSEFLLQEFANADCASYPDDRRSTSRIIVYLSANPILWSSKK